MNRSIKNWMWVTPGAEPLTDDDWRRRLDHWRQAGIDAILPEVFNNHTAHYGSQHLPVASEWLEQLLPIARAAGIEVHAWIHSMACNIEQVHDEHPEWFNVNGLGESSWDKPAYVGYYRFFCPSRPGVHEFLKRRVAELAAYGELEGIHLDYIRQPDVILASSLQPKYGIVQDREYPQYDYCYCEVCRNGFKDQFGTDPLDLEDPSANQDWRQFRYNLVTHIVNNELIPTGRERGKLMTAAVFPNWQHVRQQWGVWHLDAVLPMLYNSFYDEDVSWIGEQVVKGRAGLKSDIPLYSGLYLPGLTPEELASAVEVSLKAGAAGVSLFAAGDMTDQYWTLFETAVSQE